MFNSVSSSGFPGTPRPAEYPHHGAMPHPVAPAPRMPNHPNHPLTARVVRAPASSAASAALAVLDVLEDEGLPQRAAAVGERLRAAIGGLGKDAVTEVRGRGLLAGVQLTSGELARVVADGLREAGVLVGITGRAGDVLKIRPPLVFADEHGDLLVRALDRVLA